MTQNANWVVSSTLSYTRYMPCIRAVFLILVLVAHLAAQTTVIGAVTGVTTPKPIEFIAGTCQNATASPGFAYGAAFPSVACVSGTNTEYAVLEFDDSTDEIIQEQFVLDADYSSMNVLLTWRAGATSGDVDWVLECGCVDEGDDGDPTWVSVGSLKDTVAGVADRWNEVSLSSVDPTGCDPLDTFFWRLYRDADDVANDTATGDSDYIKLRFTFN